MKLEEVIEEALGKGFKYVWGFGPKVMPLEDPKTVAYLKSQGNEWQLNEEKSLLEATRIALNGQRLLAGRFEMFKRQPIRQVFTVEIITLSEPSCVVTDDLISAAVERGWEEGRKGNLFTQSGYEIDSEPFAKSELFKVKCRTSVKN